MVTAREKNTWNAKQAEYNSIWCQEYMVKVLDTIVKVKLYESKEEGLCVSLLVCLLCVAHKLLCTPKIDFSHFSSGNVLI